MVTFTIPVSRKAADYVADGAGRFRFSVPRRTVWMVKRSILAFKTVLYHVKPVFVVATDPPKQSVHYLMPQATFSLYFKDSIVGAIALNNFVEMLRIKNDFSSCKLQMDESIICRNKAVIDVLELYNKLPVPA